MSDKKRSAAAPRARRPARKIAELKAVRLTVHRSNLHIYAQVIDADGAKVLASASTLETEVRAADHERRQRKAAAVVGKRIAEKAKQPASSRSRSTAPATNITAA